MNKFYSVPDATGQVAVIGIAPDGLLVVVDRAESVWEFRDQEETWNDAMAAARVERDRLSTTRLIFKPPVR